MKLVLFLILAIVISFNNVLALENVKNLSVYLALEGPYLRQIQPGLIPQIFASGLVSIDGRYEFEIFSSIVL